jgi:hypothetical protein
MEAELIFQIVVPAHRPFFRPVSIHDDLLLNPMLPDRVFAGFFIGLQPECGARTCGLY